MGLTRHLAGTHAEEAHVGQHLVQPLEDTPARYSSWVVASLERTVRAAVEHANLEEVYTSLIRRAEMENDLTPTMLAIAARRGAHLLALPQQQPQPRGAHAQAGPEAVEA